MAPIPRPDLTHRSHSMTCARFIDASPSRVYDAWTTKFDIWFAAPGSLIFHPAPGQPYFFYNRIDWGRHPHYGRVLALAEDQFIEMTWLTGNGELRGTEGAETILRIDLTPRDNGTAVELTHSGFASEAACAGHAENWPLALDILNEVLCAADEP